MANKMMTLKGIEKAVKAIQKDLNKRVDEVSEAGLIKASILIRNSMAKQSPIIPVDLGNLKASWYVITKRKKDVSARFVENKRSKINFASDHSAVTSKASSIVETSPTPILIMGFSARYAMAVHEGVSAKGNAFKYNLPQSGAKFFESALWRNKEKIVEIIAKEVSNL